MSDLAKCVICDSYGATILAGTVTCAHCGRYTVDLRSGAVLSHEDFPRLRPYLPAHVRQATKRGEVVELRHDTWQVMAEGHAHTSVSRKLEMLLDLFCKESRRFGSAVTMGADDFVLIDAANTDEMTSLIRALVGQQALEQVGKGASYAVTAQGWERNTPIHPGGVPGTCFVAMALDPSLDGVYEDGIKPAVIASGLRVVNVGKVEHNGIVTDLIHAEIRRAQVVVADVTTQRPNVYFEAGFAIGLGRTVIWCCRKDEINKVHFDTRQYSHVVWTDAVDLRSKLEARIRGTVAIPVNPE